MAYQRYSIERRWMPNVIYHPHPFRVKIKRRALLKLILKEVFQYRGKKSVIVSNPCAYGVFDGPIGGFSARERLCVGCLRCTTEHPEISTILPNSERMELGDDYVTPDQVDTIIYEAESGKLAVKGAGYRGKFGGTGWDGIWTDMSEIVRPTRDGIYGREYISTEIDLGAKLSCLNFDDKGRPIGAPPKTVTLPIPILFTTLPNAPFSHPQIAPMLAEAAHQIKTYAIIPFDLLMQYKLDDPHIIPLIKSREWKAFKALNLKPALIVLEEWNLKIYKEITSHLPETTVILKTSFGADLFSFYQAGIRVFYLKADEQGRGERGKFITDLIREAHLTFVHKKCRDRVTLIGSGGIVAAEHVPKAILLGMDGVAIDIPLFLALQGKIRGENAFYLSDKVTVNWGVQRLKNLMGAWQDQLFEFAGAMGLREIRRMRGEIGRVLFQNDLEREAFAGIQGYGY